MACVFVHVGKSVLLVLGFRVQVARLNKFRYQRVDKTFCVAWWKPVNNNVHVVLWSISSCLCPSVCQLDHCVNAWCPWFVCPLSDVKTTCNACECTGCIVSSRCDHKSLIRTVVWAVAKTAHICHDVFRVSRWLACCDWDSSLPCRCKVQVSRLDLVWSHRIIVNLTQPHPLVLHLKVGYRIVVNGTSGGPHVLSKLLRLVFLFFFGCCYVDGIDVG